MEKKTTFNLRAGGATTLNLTFPYTQGIEPIKVTSLKIRKVNGKEDGSSVQVGYVIDKPPYGYIIGQTIDGFEIHYKENPSNDSRNGVITLTQNESNKQCKVNFTQAAGVIVQEYVFTGPAFSKIMFLADGGTQTVEVESYILYSDGSKVAEVPYVDSKPTWLTVEITPKSQIIGNTKYSVKVTATPNTGTTARRENLVLRQGAVEGKELTFVVFQGIPPVTDIKIELTITNLPAYGMGALFGEFEVPNSNSIVDYFAFSILGTSHKFTYKKSTGLTVNLSTPGETDIAYIGDIIGLYTWDSNSTRWVYHTQFALPGSDTTISAS